MSKKESPSRDMAFQVHMTIEEMAGNLTKYAAADTVVEQEG